MVAVAIFSADPVLRRNLEQLPRDDPAVVIVGMVDQPFKERAASISIEFHVFILHAPLSSASGIRQEKPAAIFMRSEGKNKSY